jgi:hypothetical protein
VFGLLAAVTALDEVIGPIPARLLGAAVAWAMVALLIRWDRRSMHDLGWTRPRAGRIGMGLALGVGLVGLVVGVMWTAGWYRPEFSGFETAMLQAVGLGLAVGLFEEALFRSVWFAGIEPVFGTHLTVAASAIVFGAVHLFNPDATPLSAVAIAITAGPLLGYGFAATRDIWFVTAVHAAWNITLGTGFGLAVSGNELGASVLRGPVDGPALGTGGEFGPEATVQAVVVVGAAAALLALRSRILAPVWRHDDPARLAVDDR